MRFTKDQGHSKPFTLSLPESSQLLREAGALNIRPASHTGVSPIGVSQVVGSGFELWCVTLGTCALSHHHILPAFRDQDEEEDKGTLAYTLSVRTEVSFPCQMFPCLAELIGSGEA